MREERGRNCGRKEEGAAGLQERRMTGKKAKRYKGEVQKGGLGDGRAMLEVRGPLMGRGAERNNRSSGIKKEIGRGTRRDGRTSKGMEVEHKN